jgi:hypothetical protein
MATLIDIFSLYKLTLLDKSIEYVLIRTKQPSYSNADKGQEDLANRIETEKRHLLLSLYTNKYAKDSQVEFIGELQECPLGDILYSDKGQFKLLIFFQQTAYGYPWIILGNANNILDFEKELKEDCDLIALKPTGGIKQIEAYFITENDFDLSEIKNYNAKDIRDI